MSIFPILASYCCDIPKGKDMSGIPHGTFVRRPCIWCISTRVEFQVNRCEKAWSIQVTLEVRKYFSASGQVGSSCHDGGVHFLKSMERKNANGRLKDLFLYKNASFLKDSQLPSTSVLDKAYNLIGFQLVWNLHLSTSKLLDKWTFKFLGSYREMTKHQRICEPRPNAQPKESVHSRWFEMLARGSWAKRWRP